MYLIAGATSYGGAYFGQGIDQRIHISNAQCAGSERRLIDCTHSTSTGLCTHSCDAGIRCPQGNSIILVSSNRVLEI